jgi:DMSO/TMAO reductase YedYZ molybdopterin-dependent catalytic subunit
MDEKEQRIVDARMKLRARFLEKMKATPAASDARPLGSGAPNRHGMPKLPVGQTVTAKWPVLDLGRQPNIPLSRWHLRVDGAVENPLDLSWQDLLALPQAEDVSDFHCVTGWSVPKVHWKGVRFRDLFAAARPKPRARAVVFHSAEEPYVDSLELDQALLADVMLAHSLDGRPLSQAHGAPARLVIPEMYGYKGVKWVKRIELAPAYVSGYWEQRGYDSDAWIGRSNGF